MILDRASVAGAVALCLIGAERLVNAALLSSRDLDFALRLGFGILAIVLGVVLGARATHLRRSR